MIHGQEVFLFLRLSWRHLCLNPFKWMLILTSDTGLVLPSRGYTFARRFGGDFPKRDDDERSNGSRLLVSQACLYHVLNSLEKQLIVSIEIRRRRRYRSYRSDDSGPDIPPSTLVLVIDGNGETRGI